MLHFEQFMQLKSSYDMNLSDVESMILRKVFAE